jgi:hypothetical protein
MVTQLFISHSCKDISLVKFLIHLLSYHQIKTWTSFIDPEPDVNSKQNIDQLLLSCNNLVVLITENTLSSRLVASEILIFKKVNPAATIIPLIFNKKVDLEKIAPGLEQYQSIDFTHDLTTGFRILFAKLGTEFLTHSERRYGHERRKGQDRRKNLDRRSKNLTVRLHRTFLNIYLQNSLINEKDDIDLNNGLELELLFESMKQGAKDFLCYDEIGNLYNTDFIVNLCLNQALDSLANNSHYKNDYTIKAKYLTFAIAKNMTDKFIVKCKDRRNRNDRRSGIDRREIRKSLNAMESLN